MSNLRLRSLIGIVQNEAGVEFFNSNTRESILLEIDFPEILTFLKKFDGRTPFVEICAYFPNYTPESLKYLVNFLHQNHILILDDKPYSESDKNDGRLISFLEDYCYLSSEVIEKIDLIKSSRIMIIGLGSVGSLIATYLAKQGIGNFILVDNDTVEITNIHRQYYFEDQIGIQKTIALNEELKRINPRVKCELIQDCLTEDFFEKHLLSHPIDLIINCADEPSVDYTSRIVAKYSMSKNIPHIIGGGYNLHLTLIGQTIVPYQTACFECFTQKLNELNLSDLKNVKKLHRENRKIGSFPPLSGIAATLATLDAMKIIIKKFKYLNNSNKRIEFSLKDYSIKTIQVDKNPNCEWCGNEKNNN
ncbi:hypothetical protein B9T19_05590 [Ignatzschineria sp. F8392]|uniref:HesA/MoeB/ThiF family protein n=1 Tax=Ignatzschineria sp. F8392 TaxID=1980117 RepID=UPI000B994360|nr:ThiF family adenylyltransferase [Ignatzschineria sp. F8392]OYQ80708.1 hypothetical protein B9T19_05590 [Ignatzschineria sp. F8392]